MNSPAIGVSLLLYAAQAFAQTPALAHAKLQFDQRNWDAAKQEFTALSKAAPNDVAPIFFLGKIALNQNEIEPAIKLFERCIDIDEKNADCHAWLGNSLGQAAMTTSKFKLPFLAKRTKKEFDRSVELDPNNVDGRMGEFQFYLQAPGFVGGSIDKAREQAAELERRNKLRGALAFGLLADHEKDAKGAEVAYQRAIAAAPDSAAGYNSMINLYARLKRWDDAFKVNDRMMAAITSSEPNGLLVVSRLAYLSGEQLTRGEETAKRWIANPPKGASQGNHAYAHLRLGNVYEKSGKKELARAEYQRALQYSPKLEDAKKGLENTKP